MEAVLIDVVLFTVALPVAVVVAIGLIAPKLMGEEQSQNLRLLALALVAGVMAAYQGIGGLPESIPPVDSRGWMVIIIPATFLLFLGLDLWEIKGEEAAVGALGAAVLAISSWLLLRPLIRTWETGQTVGWLAGIVVIGLVVWLAVDKFGREAPPPAVIGVFALTAVGGSGVIVLANSALVAQLLGGLAAALGAGALVAWLRPSLEIGHTELAVMIVPLVGLMVYGRFFSPGDITAVPATAAALILLAPLATLAAARTEGKLKSVLVGLGVALVVVAIAAGLAYYASETGSSGSDYGYY